MKIFLKIASHQGIFFLVSLFLFSSCGYQIQKNEVQLDSLFQGTASQQARIFVPIPDNLTQRAGPEIFLAKSLREFLSEIRGIQVVDHEHEADFILLGSILRNELKGTTANYVGTSATALAGGLSEGQVAAASYELALDFRVRMLRIVNQSPAMIRNLLWSQDYKKTITFNASTRFQKDSDSLSGASSSSVHINDSREKLYSELLSEQIARAVLDQVTQSF
jgi:hypothetical protein